MEERNLRRDRESWSSCRATKWTKQLLLPIEDRVKHPMYKKIVDRTYKLKAHDENNECNIGDRVKVMAQTQTFI